jgi:periplasmic divalent cation tolerance protein
MAFVYITCKDKEEADRISVHLLSKRLVACTNSFSIDSKYWWKGEIADEEEYVILAKTLANKYEDIKKEVKKVHSYKIPCICMIDSKSNEDYMDWVKSELKKR